MDTLPIYVGYWSDYSKSSIYGGTITLTSRGAFALTSGLSVFVSIVGACLWISITPFLLKISTRGGSPDAFSSQLQATLANSSSPSDVIRLCRAWRRTSKHGKRTNNLHAAFYILGLQLLLILGFIFAGIFVSSIASSGTADALINSGSCGVPDFRSASSTQYDKYLLEQSKDTALARAYARNCYSLDVGYSQCSLYPTQRLPYSTTQVSCPFGKDPHGQSLCSGDGVDAFRLFSEELNSNTHLGVNSGLQNQVTFRYNVTCSPINIQPYERLEIPACGGAIYKYDLGGYTILDTPFTILYNTDLLDELVGYQLSSVYHLEGSPPVNPWQPIPPLQRDDGDVSVQFLRRNNVKYLSPVHDPWFMATNESYVPGALPLYEANDLVNAMGCIDQYQICNPAISPTLCTITNGLYDLELGINELRLNNYQSTVAKRLVYALKASTTYETVIFLGANALFAQDRVNEEFESPSLPNDQWKIEVRGWYETQLAKLQHYFLSYAAPSRHTSISLSPLHLSEAETNAAQTQCHEQRITSPGSYVALSFLGLMIVICLGIIIILWFLASDTILAYFRKRRNRENGREEADRIGYQLPQLVKQAIGPNITWDSSNFSKIPVTYGFKDSRRTSNQVLYIPHKQGDEITFGPAEPEAPSQPATPETVPTSEGNNSNTGQESSSREGVGTTENDSRNADEATDGQHSEPEINTDITDDRT